MQKSLRGMIENLLTPNSTRDDIKTVLVIATCSTTNSLRRASQRCVKVGPWSRLDISFS